MLTTHRWLGTATVALALAALVVGERVSRRGGAGRSALRGMLFATAIPVLVTASFGGAMTYGLDHYAFPV